jgi:hypothetical protein
MIQRTFLRSTRLAGTVAKQQLRLPASRSQTIFRPAVLPRSFHHCSGLRSQETEQKTDAGSDSAANSGDKAVDTLKKEVEAKNKEILDFKVCYTLDLLTSHAMSIPNALIAGQIPSIRGGLSKSTRTN